MTSQTAAQFSSEKANAQTAGSQFSSFESSSRYSAESSAVSSSSRPTFADLTTICAGGEIENFVTPETEREFIEAVREADSCNDSRKIVCGKGRLCIIGGGSNMLVSDRKFEGTVIRDARNSLDLIVARNSGETQDGCELCDITVPAGVNWDDFVIRTVEEGFSGIEGLAGIPGTVGASVVQNIGAYGQEVAGAVKEVHVWDRETGEEKTLSASQMRFAYRMSVLKKSMYRAAEIPDEKYFPTPKYAVLDVTYRLKKSECGTVSASQLARALGTEIGESMPAKQIAQTVVKIRAGKSMLEDPKRYENPWMKGAKTFVSAYDDCEKTDYNRHSCGSFFVNPTLRLEQAGKLPQEAPRFEAKLPDGSKGVKTSAAWLIEHAGFAKGYRVSPESGASLSTVHTLAVTNRGNATYAQIIDLAETIRDGVEKYCGIRLIPEPVHIS